MFLPATYLQLHAAIGSNLSKKPLEVLVKPDQILAMLTVNAKAGAEDDPQAKPIELTRLIVPFSDAIYVQEPPALIAKMIIDAFNADVEQVQAMQNGLILASGGAIPPGKLQHPGR
jgi:hypothetical protein